MGLVEMTWGLRCVTMRQRYRCTAGGLRRTTRRTADLSRSVGRSSIELESKGEGGGVMS